MTRTLFNTLIAATLLLASSGLAYSHGLIQDPPSRNWFCGAITKPDHVLNGVAQYPVCGDAFAIDFSAGYNFMSVLTHTQGRFVLGSRPHVCGYGSETWNGAATVWDQPIDWPTTNVTAGPMTFTWNILWGPHFSDTQEFRYWITRPGFSFQVGRELSFTDFEDQPFCSLNYNDSNPSGNPNVIPEKANNLFRTRCTVPQRQGRHVIYAEWGRNAATSERFHGCMDVVFQGTPSSVDARIALAPNVTEFTGNGSITLDARGSVGTNLTYQWSVSSQNPSLYTIGNANQPVATLFLANPQAAGNVTVTLVATGPGGSDTAVITLVHRPSVTSPFFDLGQLVTQARTLNVGDQVSVRTVLTNGQDVFYPSSPLVITAATTGATAWPSALAQAINSMGGGIRIGLLNSQGQVVPVQDATANRVFALNTANVASAFLQVVPNPGGGVTARVATTNDWGSGYCASLTVTNNTSQPVTWNVTFVAQGTVYTVWNATFATSGSQITARGISWNAVLAPGQSTHSIGFCANR